MHRHHPDALCEQCPLADENSYVPTQFPRVTNDRPLLAIVGEAPGFNERVQGIPFTGSSGKLLNKVLEYHGIDRKACIVTNACSCRPEDNATPSKEAVIACRPRLIKEIDSAEQILALGNTAAKDLLQTTQGITALRAGAPRDWKDKKLVASIHPAACLRQGDMFPHLVNDTGKLVNSIPEWVPPQFVVVDDEESALDAIKQLHVITDRLVVDIECGIDKDNSFDHPNEYEMLCIGVCYAKGKVCVFGENSLTKSVYVAMRGLFLSKKLIAHNGKFDLEGLFPHMGALTLWFDTMLAHYCLDERPGVHALGYLGPELLGTPDWKHEIGQYLGPGKNYASIPRPVLYRYNAYDDAVTWDLMELFEKQLETEAEHHTLFGEMLTGKTLRNLHDFLIEASNQLMFLELNGITIDRAVNQGLADEYLGEMKELEEKMDKLCNEDYDKKGGINPRSPLQVKKFLAANDVITDSTNEDHLNQLLVQLERLDRTNARVNTLVEFVNLLLGHRRKAKLYGTYVKGIAKRTYHGRVFTTYMLHGSTSGRLASRNPNLQNIDRDKRIRAQFSVSKLGNILVHGDYKQAEGRIICTLAQDEYLQSIFLNSDRDIFSELGKRLYSKDELTKGERVRVKAYFYGIGYGRDAYSIAMEYGWSPKEAERDLAAFMELIPGVKEWQRSVRRWVLDGNDLTTSFGRRRRFWLITKENKKDVLNEALSFLPQSMASDICLRALIRLRPKLRGLGFIRLTIHDALAAECAEKDREEVSELLRSEMVQSGKEWSEYVPFPVDLSYGTNWGSL